jgi:hypothetical protein
MRTFSSASRPSLGFRGLGAELGCHVGIGTGDLNVADSVDEVLVAVRIRLASDQVALDTVPAGVAPERQVMVSFTLSTPLGCMS